MSLNFAKTNRGKSVLCITQLTPYLGVHCTVIRIQLKWSPSISDAEIPIFSRVRISQPNQPFFRHIVAWLSWNKKNVSILLNNKQTNKQWQRRNSVRWDILSFSLAPIFALFLFSSAFSCCLTTLYLEWTATIVGTNNPNGIEDVTRHIKSF